MESPSDWIHLKHWSFPCLVGINRNEQERNQKLDVEISLGLDLEQAAAGDLLKSVHYGHVLDEVQFIAQRGHWKLLESMAHVLAVHLLAAGPVVRRAAVEQVVVRLGKPEIFHGQAMPSVEIRRSAGWLLKRDARTFSLGAARCVVLHETAHSGAYHAMLQPGATFVVPSGAAALTLSNTIVVNGERRKSHQLLNAGERALIESTEETTLLLAARSPLSESAALRPLAESL